MAIKRHKYQLRKEDLLPEIEKWKSFVKSKAGDKNHIPYVSKGGYSYEGYRFKDNYAVFHRVCLSSFRQTIMFKMVKPGLKIEKYAFIDMLHRTDGPAIFDEHGYAFYLYDRKMGVEKYYEDNEVKEQMLINLINEVLSED